jgi:hypothetical protein
MRWSVCRVAVRRFALNSNLSSHKRPRLRRQELDGFLLLGFVQFMSILPGLELRPRFPPPRHGPVAEEPWLPTLLNPAEQFKHRLQSCS